MGAKLPLSEKRENNGYFNARHERKKKKKREKKYAQPRFSQKFPNSEKRDMFQGVK
jgi:hypothetical protein